MKENDVIFFRSFLLNQKTSLMNKTLEFKSQQRTGRGLISDEAEIASYDLSINLSINLHEKDRTALYQIEKALSKISQGNYGQCEACGEEIAVKRLKVKPFASFCIHCMEEYEDPRNNHMN